MAKRRKSPPEKKAASYERDRRNVYGENSKSSRKNIRIGKALERRAQRRTAKAPLAKSSQAKESEVADAMQTKATARHRRRFKKLPDVPLAGVVEAKLARRVRRHGAKTKRRAERAK